jgi:hypothetical protein
MITRISVSFMGGTTWQCAGMTINRALIPSKVPVAP